MKTLRTHATGLALALALGTAVSGCYGSFALTRKLHGAIGMLGNKFVSEAAYLVCAGLQIYSVTGLVDFWVLNTLEFWTGVNPLNVVSVREVQEGSARVVMKYDPAADRVRVDVFDHGSHTGTTIVTREADGSAIARNSDGSVLTARTGADGTVIVARADGNLVRAYPAN